MNEDTIRIGLLEYIGWTELSRQRKFSVGALKGTSPDGKKDQYAPNPVKSLDSLREVERVLSDGRKHCWSLMERYGDRIYEGGLALEGAEVKAKQLYYVLYPEPE